MSRIDNIDKLVKENKELLKENDALSILVNHKDKRIQELLESNNKLLERARKAESDLNRVTNISGY